MHPKSNTPPDPLKTHTVTLKQPGCVITTKCGHRWDPRDDPRHSCHFCWEAYWNLHPAELEAVRSALKVYGKENIVKRRGESYFKWATRFIRLWEQQETQQAQVLNNPTMCDKVDVVNE
jgi:hypothetical protein